MSQNYNKKEGNKVGERELERIVWGESEFF